MGGDGQGLMNKRKHLLAFQSGQKRTVRSGCDDNDKLNDKGGDNNGTDDNDATLARYAVPDAMGWAMCACSGEPLMMMRRATKGEEGNGGGGGKTTIAGVTYAPNDIVVDFLGNLYLREQVLAALITRAELAKVGAASVPSHASEAASSVPVLSSSSLQHSELLFLLKKHCSSTIRTLAHIRKFKDDFTELNKDSYDLPHVNNNTIGNSSSGNETNLDTATLTLRCPLSGLAAPPKQTHARNADGLTGASSASTSIGGGGRTNSGFVCLWRCGHCFNANALLTHWRGIMRLSAHHHQKSHETQPQGDGNASSNRSNAEHPSSPSPSSSSSSPHSVSSISGVALCCPQCGVSVSVSLNTVVGLGGQKKQEEHPRLITTEEWASVLSFGGGALDSNKGVDAVLVGDNNRTAITDSTTNYFWYEHDVFLRSAGVKASKHKDKKLRRFIVPLVCAAQDQLAWL